MASYSLRNLLVLALAAGPVACHHGDHDETVYGAQALPGGGLVTPLRWAPTDNPEDQLRAGLAPLAGHRLAMTPFGDHRAIQDRIGTNTEEAMPRPVVTPDNVPAFVSEHIGRVLYEAHFPLVPANPTEVIHGDVIEFFVTEGNRYEGTVTLDVQLTDPQGRELWHGPATGHSRRFGHSLNAEMYMNALSDGILDAVKNLLENPQFQLAMHAAPPPVVQVETH